MSDVRFGKASYSGNGSKRTKTYKLSSKDAASRTMVLRMAPPFEGALPGSWRRFVKQHWGYYLKGDDGQKSMPVLFLCPEQTDRNGNVTVQCPECQERLKYEKRKEEKAAELKKEGKTDEEIKVATQHLTQWLKAHNLDKAWYVLAKDLIGEWGYGVIKYKAMKVLLEKMNKLLADEGIDSLSPENGAWWKFTRSGSGEFGDSVDIPEQYQEEVIIEGRKLKAQKLDTFTQTDIDQLSQIDPLSTIGRALTVDQIGMIVQSGGDETIIRSVLNMPARASNPAPAKTSAQPAVVPEETIAKVAAVDDEVAQLRAKLAAAEAKAAKPAAAKTESLKPPAEIPSNIKTQLAVDDMESFLKQFQPEGK